MLMSAVFNPRGSFVPNTDFGDDVQTSGYAQKDFTDAYNTKLTEDEEAQFQTWAKANNRLGDLYDYDMRGAWKAGATQAENGHFPDTFKKPNHPTFSVESKYSTDDLKGGEWKNVNGKMVFRPGHELSESEASYLKKYFNDKERGVKLDVSGLVRSDAFMRKQFVRSVFANPNEPSMFEGFTGTWRAIPASFLSTVSAGIDAMSVLPIRYLATTDEAKEWLKGMSDNMNDTAQRIREYRDLNFGVNSYRAGSATQVIHGLIETLPKAALYSTGLGLTAGALAFGSEYGINRMQELKAQGVDTKTAAIAGAASFFGGAVGLRLPPALGPNRIMSAIYGGLTNAGIMGAELQTINWVLKNQNYDSLAKSYQLNMTDTLVATGLGAFMGGAFWRRPLTAAERRNNVYIKHRAELTSQWTKELLGVKNEDGTQKFTQEEAETQARAGANAVASYCNQYGISPEQFWSKKPDVSFDENGNVSIVNYPQSGEVTTFNQSAWHGSPYRFDSFSMDHVGSGEGNQVHGYGLYTSLERSTAQGYKERLSLAKKNTEEEIYEYVRKHKFSGKTAEQWYTYLKSQMDLIDRISQRDQYKEIADRTILVEDLALSHESPESILDGIKTSGDDISQEAIAWFKKTFSGRRWTLKPNKTTASLYRIDIPDDSVMLREEAKISDQTEFVKSAIEKIRSDAKKEYEDAKKAYEDEQNRPVKTKEEYLSYLKAKLDENEYEFVKAVSDNITFRNVSDIARERGIGIIRAGRIRRKIGQDIWHDLLVASGGNAGTEKLGIALNNARKFYELVIDDDTVGRDLYRGISKHFGDDAKRASKELNKLGVKGIRYNGARDGECAVLFDDKSINILEVLQRIKNGQIAGKYSTDNKIKLTPHANLSTFSHEMGHWYLEQTFDLFASGHQNELLQQDTEILMKALGVKSIDEWNAMSPEAKTKAHETFADWVEQYLSTGKVPDSSMAGVMKRIADWIVGVYHSVLGTDTQKVASDVIAERHEAQFGEKLPPLSDEVKSILDRLYKDQLEPKNRPTNDQTAAARTMLAHRQNELRTNAFAEGSATPAERAETQRQGIIAQQTAIAQMLAGENVDVSAAVSNMALSEGAIGNADSNFGKGFVLGADSDTSTIVVLQNRNRNDSVVSTIQINDIASKPQYGLTSFSRDTTQGAPIVSYGKLPDDAYLGRQDYVVDNGERIPVQYAVMESDSLQTSNFATGANNPRYGQSVDDTQVVAGNGRVIGLRESYRRGTGKQYQADMAEDSATHGIKPEVIQGMQSPVLVRIMPPEKVSTDFVKRSNRSNVMGMDVLEKARQDAPLIRTRIGEYTFNEDGTPTSETAMKFIGDVGEITELKSLLTDDGRVKDSATKRINAAVFYEAYRSDALTKLFDDPDVNIKRVLNAMTALAPKVIQIRESSKGVINLANPFVEGANAVRTARKEGTLGKDVGEQAGLFSSGAELPFSSVFTQNANSEGGILRILNPLLDWTNQKIAASNDPMFSTGSIDLADVAQELRRLQNTQRKASGMNELPDVDVEGIRASLAKAQEVSQSVQKEIQMKDPNAVAQAQAHAQEALQTKSEIDIEFNDLLMRNPDSVISLGEGQNKTISEIQQEIQSIQEQARTDSLAIGEAMVCILRNRGI